MRNNFSRRVKESISQSREEAARLGNDFISTEHLFLGLIKETGNNAVAILRSFAIELTSLQKEVEVIAKGNSAYKNNLPLTEQAEKVIRDAVSEAGIFKSCSIQTEHILLAILKNNANAVTQILNRLGIDYGVTLPRAKNSPVE